MKNSPHSKFIYSSSVLSAQPYFIKRVNDYIVVFIGNFKPNRSTLIGKVNKGDHGQRHSCQKVYKNCLGKNDLVKYSETSLTADFL